MFWGRLYLGGESWKIRFPPREMLKSCSSTRSAASLVHAACSLGSGVVGGRSFSRKMGNESQTAGLALTSVCERES